MYYPKQTECQSGATSVMAKTWELTPYKATQSMV